jgi:hypothetical protein
MVVYQDSARLFTTSAIAAAVLGFALQETLGNAFAGLAIQTEKPFKVGHWISVAGHEGRVAEVTWRATKIKTKAGNLVILPNNVVAREAINNYTEPTAPTRLFVEVGATYSAPPNEVREALFAAMRRSPYVLEDPKPDVLLTEFASSAITYRARFWIENFENDDFARDGVNRSIYYEFARRNIEIPWPIQVEYSREETREEPTSEPSAISQSSAGFRCSLACSSRAAAPGRRRRRPLWRWQSSCAKEIQAHPCPSSAGPCRCDDCEGPRGSSDPRGGAGEMSLLTSGLFSRGDRCWRYHAEVYAIQEYVAGIKSRPSGG